MNEFKPKYLKDLLQETRAGRLKNYRLIVLGDSHTNIFNFIDHMLGIKLQSCLAYSLGNSKHHIYFLIKEALQLLQFGSYSGSLGFCFGEIDCRYQLAAQIIKRNINKEMAARSIAQNYVETMLQFMDGASYKLYEQLLIIGPSTTSMMTSPNLCPLPRVGSPIIRNELTFLLSYYMKIYCQKNGVRFINQCDYMLDRDMETRQGLLLHDGHQAPKCAQYIKRLLNAGMVHTYRKQQLDSQRKYEYAYWYLLKGLFSKNELLSILSGGEISQSSLIKFSTCGNTSIIGCQSKACLLISSWAVILSSIEVVVEIKRVEAYRIIDVDVSEIFRNVMLVKYDNTIVSTTTSVTDRIMYNNCHQSVMLSISAFSDLYVKALYLEVNTRDRYDLLIRRIHFAEVHV